MYVFNGFNLLVSFCLFGTDTLLVKMVAVYNENRNTTALKSLFVFVMLVVLTSSIFLSFLSWLVLKITGIIQKLPINWFAIALPTLLLLSLTAVNQAYLQGLKRVLRSQFAEKIVRPLLMILIIALFLYSGKTISAPELIWLNVALIAITALLSFWFVRSSAPDLWENITSDFESRYWLASAFGFFSMGVLSVLNARIDILLLGALRSNHDVGVYNVVLKLSELGNFFLVIVNFIVAPMVAALYKKGAMAQLQKIVTRSAQVVLATTLPLLIGFIVFRKPLLLLFGAQFLNGQQAFVILCLGQLLNILFGSVGTLLLMSGHQKFSILSLAISLVVNVLLNILLTPRYGTTGTAIASATGIGLWNLLMYFFARTKLKIRTTAFGMI